MTTGIVLDKTTLPLLSAVLPHSSPYLLSTPFLTKNYFDFYSIVELLLPKIFINKFSTKLEKVTCMNTLIIKVEGLSDSESLTSKRRPCLNLICFRSVGGDNFYWS